MSHLLGIDVGTSGTKTLICDPSGKVLATAMAEHPISSPRPGWSEQNPRDWWKAAVIATHAVLKKAKIKPTEIAAIGLSGQMHGSVFLADGPKPLRPALLWNDQRTAEQCRQIESKAGGRAALVDLVANPASPDSPRPKSSGSASTSPRFTKKPNTSCSPRITSRFCLTGEYATEVSDASGTLLLDVANRTWSTQLLELLQIDAALLPRLHESPEITGTLTKAAARELGLLPGIPVVGGAGDQAAGAVGNGIVSPGVVSATLGTSGVVFAHSESPSPRSPRPRPHHVPCRPRQMVRLRLHALRRRLPMVPQPARPSRSRRRQETQHRPIRTAHRPSRNGPTRLRGDIFLPYLTGERCPHPDPQARGGWIGVTSRTTRHMLIRSLLEGVTFGMRDALEIMQAMNIPIDPNPRQRRRRPQPILATTPGRHLPPTHRLHQCRRRPRLRRSHPRRRRSRSLEFS